MKRPPEGLRHLVETVAERETYASDLGQPHPEKPTAALWRRGFSRAVRRACVEAELAQREARGAPALGA